MNDRLGMLAPLSWRRLSYVLIYAALVVVFLAEVARFHDTRTGFTSMVMFGDLFAPGRLSRLHDVPIYTYDHSAGYDGQFYAQIAVAGNPFDPELRAALDSPSYRPRRILLPVLAHLVGLGRPSSVLAVYALANVVCWLILAWLLARWWFPPGTFHDLLRWAGMMFGAGMLVSISRALTDGPALLVIAVGVRCLEIERRWLAAVILGAAGLARDTSVLAAAAFVPPQRPGRQAWRQGLLAAAICALPAVVWACVLLAHYGDVSTGAVGLPLVAFLGKCRQIISASRARGLLATKDEIFVVIATCVQVGFVLTRRRPAVPWWRIGAAFAGLAALLGPVVWEDALSTVPRGLLPLTLAFNVLVPRSPRGLGLLLAGNLTVLSMSSVFSVVPTKQTTFVRGISCEYGSGWYSSEHLGRRTWRWASGPAAIRFHNPGAAALRVTLEFDLISETDRTVELRARDTHRAFSLQGRRRIPAALGPLALSPGDTILEFNTSEPPWTEPGPGGRALSFSLQNLSLTAAE